MITPVFSISQDSDFLTFIIRAPYAKIAETEIEYGEDLFVFSSPPYYLRVHLPRCVIQDDRGNAKYDSDKGEFTVLVPKQMRGEEFPQLDMITELLRPQKTEISAKPMVEEIGNDSDDGDYGDEEGDEYLSEQRVQDVSAGIKDEEAARFGYGFGWRRTGVFEQLRGEIGNVIDLCEPEMCSIDERVQRCAEFDVEHFDPDRYLVDTLDPSPELNELITTPFSASLSISDTDRDKLKDFPARKLPRLSPSDTRATALSLIDIVFAWAYDQRVNDWEESCESGWTVGRLAPTLMFLVKWNSAKEAACGAMRRALCYPLYRNWDLACRVLEDTKTIISTGRSAIVHVLCCVHSLMIKSSEFRYLLNDLIITDLCLWAQSVPEEVILQMSVELKEVQITKDVIGLDLENLEVEGRLAVMNIDRQDSDDESD